MSEPAAFRITISAENVVAQSFTIPLPHGTPFWLTRPLTRDTLEDLLDYVKTQVLAGQFDMVDAARADTKPLESPEGHPV